MISLLNGIIRHKKAPHLIIECAGVGYEVEATLTAFTQLPEVNQPATLYTHLIIREDAHVLFGFATLAERDLFRVLIKVNGIGPKMGLAILSGMTASELGQVIANQDTLALTRLPGIGKKTAERLIVELKDKFPALAPDNSAGEVSNTAEGQAKNDAVDALVQLGYKPAEAEKMVESVYQPDSDSGELIRRALQAKLKR